ncbi:MAG: sigma-E factor negative regulatory protein [Proteobacteria bacterium]|nr:sigma-E factor negative regulatory protein [Pseudomonadota bacterium]
MKEDLSRLMDGDLDDEAVAAVWPRLKGDDCLAVWSCYHVIGDTLRGNAAGPSMAVVGRTCLDLQAEPTVLAPSRRRATPKMSFLWSAAATVAAVGVVGWTAVSLTNAPATALARAKAAGDVSPAQVHGQAVPADYLLAHQEYSPATAMQGVGPYLRAVSAPANDAR